MQDSVGGRRWWAVFVGMALVLGACGNGFKVTIRESQKRIPAGESTLISVQVHYPPAGVVYRWVAKRGRCEPQASPDLTTTYRAPLEPGEDHVKLEIVSETGRVIYTTEITLQIVPAGIPQGAPEKGPVPPPDTTPRPPQQVFGPVDIRVTQVPPYDAVGGDTTRADIAGEVSGLDTGDYRVVLYACTDKCYVQPLVAAPFTAIRPGGFWKTWTHTGERYLVLVVPVGFQPRATLARPDVPLDGPIGRMIVEGQR